MALADPLLVCREVLLADPDVAAIVGTRVYSTPVLPVGHQYPLVRLTLIGGSAYSPVDFRYSAAFVVQCDMWAESMPDLYALREATLTALHGPPPDGARASYIRPTSEVISIEEALQPVPYRCRADLAVRVVNVPAPAVP